jgi:hypothetical protein
MASREGRKLGLVGMPAEVKIIILQNHFRQFIFDLNNLELILAKGHLGTADDFEPFSTLEVLPLAPYLGWNIAL